MEIGNDRVFKVRWGKGYPETEPRIVTMKQIEESEDWNLDAPFISALKTVRIQNEFDYDLKWVDPSGEVFFKGLTEGAMINPMLESMGFVHENTGGGCTAYTSDLGDGNSIMITDGQAGTDFQEEGQVWISVHRNANEGSEECAFDDSDMVFYGTIEFASGQSPIDIRDRIFHFLSYFQPKMNEFMENTHGKNYWRSHS
jgi:hypothetical protein